jgi:predicted TIM-barrel fold metal-dependent hydrolase
MYADHLLRPWFTCLIDELPGCRVFDAHTHVGDKDPSGFSSTWEELLAAVDAVNGRAVVFPMSETEGYRAVNLACADAASRSGGRLTAFARITPDEVKDGVLEEALNAGARGIKLHLSSDEFDLGDRRLDPVFATADERRLPVIVHAGPEVASIGAEALATCTRWRGLRLVLAHCAIADLGRLWPRVPEVPNLFFDTSWWTASHLMALFRLVPPGRVLAASDLPYSTPLSHLMATARCGWQAGLDRDQIASVLGGQMARLVDGQDPLDLGPPPTAEPQKPGPFLEIVWTNLVAALEAMQRGLKPETPLSVARHGCAVGGDDPDAPVLASVLELLDLYEKHHPALPPRNQFRPGWDLVAAAAVVARTPAAPLP